MGLWPNVLVDNFNLVIALMLGQGYSIFPTKEHITAISRMVKIYGRCTQSNLHKIIWNTYKKSLIHETWFMIFYFMELKINIPNKTN